MPSLPIKPIRVLLIEGYEITRLGLRTLIEREPGLTVVGEATNRAESISAARAQPDIIILDPDLGRESSLDFLPELLAVARNARALILTDILDPALHHRAVRLGAMGLVLKMEAARVMTTAIRKIHAGEVWLNRSMIASVLSEMRQARETKPLDAEAAKIARLTEREREVIALVGEGIRNKQIAERLIISEPTVRHYLTSIYEKIGVADRLELMIYAYQHNLAKLPTCAHQHQAAQA